MHTTYISVYSLRAVLREVVLGKNVCGYTVRPGFSNGLILTNCRAPCSGLVGL